ncbi:MAG: hypothetical protein VB074_16600 [Proteiniphilum sp.]|jgi:hypothetical protein|uniref:hypothetical protein n=1 Tax=Proteiniphilum sp. TaxID=1926877 RepID=UPI002B1EEA5B|nr:hypothetical protein [Proteiniphilum sp.]MEA5129798.1 hypothetical protein [Proteiniphilum sp.]
MKKIFHLFIFLFLLMNGFAQDNNGFENAVRQAVEEHIREYPQSTLKDLYKNFFQDVYGPGHLLNDTIAAKNYLLRELASYTEIEGKIAEPTGYRHNFYRVNLSVIKNNLIPFDLFFDAFMQSAKDFKPVDIEEWKKEWHRIEAVIRSMQLPLPDYDKEKNEIIGQLNQGKYIGHHSQLFNDNYRPHYRIISTKVYHTLILPAINRNAD